MIQKNSTNSNFTMYLEGDTGVSYDFIYMGTKVGMHLAGGGNGLTKFDVMVYDGGHSVTQTYYSDQNGDLSVDLRNVLRKAYLAGVGASHWIRIDSEIISTSVTDVLLEAVYSDGGISYNDIWAPYGRECLSVLSEVDDPHIITPPNVIWNVPGGFMPGIESNVENVTWRQIEEGGSLSLATINDDSIMANVSNVVGFRVERGTAHYDWNFKIAGDCDTMMAIAWTSRTGRTKKFACFPVVSKITDISTLDLDIIGNGFNGLKNRQECYRCRLDGLTPYSLWYYQDILFSPTVYATLDPTDTGWLAGTDLSKAVVMGDTSEVKAGYDLRSFEFIIKLRHYDIF